MSNIHPVRVKTSEGWQELALTGPQGPPGPAGQPGSIPGEIKLWPNGTTLPDPIKYGKWVWADGAAYAAATYPEASANIAPAWKTFGGAADPGAGMFRVPDLRGLVPVAPDAMPTGSARKNRLARAAAITVAAMTGEEFHTLITSELPAHAHAAGTLAVNSHQHGTNTGTVSADHQHYSDHGYHTHRQHGDRASGENYGGYGGRNYIAWEGTPPESTYIAGWTGGISQNHTHAISAEAPGINGSSANAGGGGTHENLPPTVFVPYIVRLDG